MTVRLSCPECGKRIRIPNEYAGRRGKCPKCGAPIEIPEVLGSDTAAEIPPPASDDADDDEPFVTVLPKQEFGDLIDMTAMVDIVFFILIFFLVTSLMGMQSSINMPTPQPQEGASRNPTSVAEYEADDDYAIVRIADDNTVWVDGSMAPSTQELVSRLKKLHEGDGKRAAASRMLVLGNPEAQHGTLVMVLDAGAEAGLEPIEFALENEDE